MEGVMRYGCSDIGMAITLELRWVMRDGRDRYLRPCPCGQGNLAAAAHRLRWTGQPLASHRGYTG